MKIIKPYLIVLIVGVLVLIYAVPLFSSNATWDDVFYNLRTILVPILASLFAICLSPVIVKTKFFSNSSTSVLGLFVYIVFILLLYEINVSLGGSPEDISYGVFGVLFGFLTMLSLNF